MQQYMGELALQISVAWLCGEDIGNDDLSMGREWLDAKNGLSHAMRDAQTVLGKRMKIGTVWVGFHGGKADDLAPVRDDQKSTGRTNENNSVILSSPHRQGYCTQRARPSSPH